MSLITEDGSVVTGAESYASVDYADNYFALRGIDTWAALSPAAQEAALRLATEYMTQRYRSQWQGLRVSASQELDWPRDYVYLDPVAAIVPTGMLEYSNLVPNDIVPEPVKKACSELALRASSSDLWADLTQGVTREKVGQIEVEYDRASPQRTRYPAIDAMLAPYLKSGSGLNMGLVRC